MLLCIFRAYNKNSFDIRNSRGLPVGILKREEADGEEIAKTDCCFFARAHAHLCAGMKLVTPSKLETPDFALLQIIPRRGTNETRRFFRKTRCLLDKTRRLFAEFSREYKNPRPPYHLENGCAACAACHQLSVVRVRTLRGVMHKQIVI